VSLPGLETETVGMLEAAGICPAWIYAYQHTGGLLLGSDGSFASRRDQAEWVEVISRYVRVHQPGATVDHQAETRKLANIMTSVTLQMAADDPGYGAAMAMQLGTVGGPAGTDSALLREYLRACADELGSTLRRPRDCPGGRRACQGLGRCQPGQPPGSRSARRGRRQHRRRCPARHPQSP